jgi:hypothetical protein
VNFIVVAHTLGLSLTVELPQLADVWNVCPDAIAASFGSAAKNAAPLRMMEGVAIKNVSISRHPFTAIILQGKLV